MGATPMAQNIDRFHRQPELKYFLLHAVLLILIRIINMKLIAIRQLKLASLGMPLTVKKMAKKMSTTMHATARIVIMLQNFFIFSSYRQS